MSSKRRLIREHVMQALYAHEVSQQPLPSLIERNFYNFEDNKHDFDFAKKLLSSVIEHKLEFDAFLQSKAKHWELDRIALIDKLLMWMGMCEIEYFDDIPPKVSINEMIEISKKFSTDDSGKFINGILDVFLHDLKTKGLFIKKGRGLLTTEGGEETEARRLAALPTPEEQATEEAGLTAPKKKRLVKKRNPADA